MRVITRDTVAKEAPAKWNSMHPNIPLPFPPAEECTAEIVNKVIKSYFSVSYPVWTDVPSCDEYNAYDLHWVAEVGEKSDYDSHTAYLCKDCIIRLFHLMQE